MNYDAFATTFSNSRKDMHWPEVDAILADIEKNGSESILDIGCGNGRFLTEMKNSKGRIKNYTGADNSSGMIEEAKKLHPGYDFRVASMESLLTFEPTNLRTYDSIVFLASFHHLDTSGKRLETLRQAKNLLTPRGRIYLTNWNLRDQPKYESMKTGDGEYSIKIGEFSRYYHGFTLDELEGLFLESGYTIVENRIFEGGRNFYSIISPK